MPFFWTIPEGSGSSGEGPLTHQFLLNRAEFETEPDLLCSDDLWVAYEDGGRFLHARIFVDALEELEDDVLLVWSDCHHSEYFQRIGERDDRFSVGEMEEIIRLKAGRIYPISEDISEDLKKNVNQSDDIRLVKPPHYMMVPLSSVSESGATDDYLRRLETKLRRRYTRNELFRYHKMTHLDPFEYFTYHFASEKGSLGKRAKKRFACKTREESNRHRTIETELQPIDPKKVKVRRFLSPTKNQIVMFGLESFYKMERAEKAHQDMLRDISAYLISLGHVPKENRNVDLYLECRNLRVLFELKTSNDANFHSQALKGAMQAVEYSYAFQRASLPIDSKYVVICNIQDENLKDYYRGVLGHIDVGLLLYRPLLGWPDRVQGQHAVSGSPNHRFYNLGDLLLL